MTDIELVIFDCDGVLVDSEPIALRGNVESFAEFGHTVTEELIVHEFLGKSNDAILEIASGWIGPQQALAWNTKFRKLYYDTLAEQVEPVDGIVEALDQIDIPMCVASSGTHEKMAITLGRTGLYQRFEGRIFSATEVSRGKPEPDLFLHAAFQLGVRPDACAVIEDSQYGVRAARAAGMRSFGYAGGVTPAAWLQGPGTVVFHDMRELPALLKEKPATLVRHHVAVLVGDDDPQHYVGDELGAGEEAGQDEQETHHSRRHAEPAGKAGADAGDPPAVTRSDETGLGRSHTSTVGRAVHYALDPEAESACTLP